MRKASNPIWVEEQDIVPEIQNLEACTSTITDDDNGDDGQHDRTLLVRG